MAALEAAMRVALCKIAALKEVINICPCGSPEKAVGHSPRRIRLESYWIITGVAGQKAGGIQDWYLEK